MNRTIPSRREHMYAMKKCHFKIKSVEEFTLLRMCLSNHMDCLLKLCPNPGSVHLSLLAPIAAIIKSTDLRVVGEVYAAEADQRRDQRCFYKTPELARSFELVESVAELKAAVQELTGKAHVRFWRMQDIQYHPEWTFGNDKSMSAVEHIDQSIRYIVSASGAFRNAVK